MSLVLVIVLGRLWMVRRSTWGRFEGQGAHGQRPPRKAASVSLTRPRPRAQSCSKLHVIAVRRACEAGKPPQAWAAQATWRPRPPPGAPAVAAV